MWPVCSGPIAAVLIACSTATTIATTPVSTCSDRAGRQQLRVRVAVGALDPLVMAAARAEVVAIWKQYQIDVVWEPARESDQASPDLWLEFVDAPLPSVERDGRMAIARMTFDNGVPANRIEVSAIAARVLLAKASCAGGTRSLRDAPDRLRSDALGRIIGRALAHEIGHYLLASPKHAERGLMRAVLYPEYLVSPSAAFLTLHEADVRALRVARVARCERSVTAAALSDVR